MKHLLQLGALSLLLCAVTVARAQTAPAGNSTDGCLIRDFSKVDWTTTKDACATLDSPNFCNACICGVGVTLVVGLDAAGVKVNGQPITTLAATDSGAVNGLLGQCQTTLGLQLLQSGAVTAEGVAKLAKCDVQAAGNTCLAQVTSGNVGGVQLPPTPVKAAAGDSGNSSSTASGQPAAAPARSSADGRVGGSSGVRALAYAIAGFVVMGAMA